MRDAKEVQAAIEILRITGELVQKNLDDKTLTKKQAEEMQTTVEGTLNIFNWVMGADVDQFTKSPIADKVISLAKEVNLFKDLE